MSRKNKTTSTANQASLFNRNGIALAAQNKLAEAAQNFVKAIALAPGDADAHNNLGNIFKAQGRFMEARACYEQALSLNPNLAMAHNNLGLVYLQQRLVPQAVVSLRRALVLNKQNHETLYNLGNALAVQGKPAEAEEAYRKALAKNPDWPEALMNLGSLLAMQDRSAEAEPLFRQALALRPTFAEAAYNLGNALQDQGKWTEAILFFDQTLSLRGPHPNAFLNKANALSSLRRFPEAEEIYTQAASLAPQNAAIHANRAMMALRQGDLPRGFELYKARWQTGQLSRPPSSAPLWDGDSLEGKTILLHAEQGLGDTLQFVRYAKWVKEKGATRLVLRAPAALTRLLTRVQEIDAVIDEEAPLPPHDCLASLMDLPHLFGTTLETIPCSVPYLTADPKDEALWAARLAPFTGLKIGLVWAGNPRLDQPQSRAVDRRRSLPLAAFAPLAKLAGLHWISLQKGAPASQAAHPPEGMQLFDGSEELGDFADTAALIAHLDLVISVDTSVVHLAGAMGKPVFMLSRYDGCWRWLLDRTDSPWYPTLRLFHQETFGDWSGAIAALKDALSSFSSAASA